LEKIGKEVAMLYFKELNHHMAGTTQYNTTEPQNSWVMQIKSESELPT
jgi:hypothetical protein